MDNIPEQKMEYGKEKNGSIQSLRAIAFVGVFLCHAGYRIHWSGLGVSLFFTLSGTLLYSRYHGSELDDSVRGSFLFAWNKVKKIYPLHILTMITAILLLLINSKFQISRDFFKSVFPQSICNVFLIQSWIPNAEFCIGLNGVAWYLSTAFFLYFSFPKINKIFKKISVIVCVCVFVCYVLVSLLIGSYFFKRYGESSNVYLWYMYIFPLFRLSDFIAGCCLGKILSRLSFSEISKTRKLTFTVIELFSIVFVAVVNYFIQNYPFNHLAVKVINNWSTPYMFMACILIAVFTLNLGYITDFINNRFLRFIGDLSPYAFLIHYQVIFYSAMIISRQLPNIKISSSLIILIQFTLSIILSRIYYFISKKNNRVDKMAKRN